MTHKKKFINAVYKDDGTNRLIEVGDTAHLVLKDDTIVDVTVTYVSDDGRWIGWNISVSPYLRRDDIKGVSSLHNRSCANYGGATPTTHGTEDPIEWPSNET
jgi:hypothetical protein